MEQQADNSTPETKETTHTPEAAIPSPEPENQDQINWRKFREQRELDRKASEEAHRRASEKEAEASALKAAMESLLNKRSTNSVENGSQLVDEDEDTRIQKKVNIAIAEREKIADEHRRQREMAEYPQRLAQTYTDFNQVCSQENVDYLEYHYPEIATAFKHMPEGFDRWSSIYKAVKRFVPNTAGKKEQIKIEKNISKPQAMSTPGVTQTGDSAPVMLDDKRRADNWARMQRTIKGI